jgi:hypothetical protein
VFSNSSVVLIDDGRSVVDVVDVVVVVVVVVDECRVLVVDG